MEDLSPASILASLKTSFIGRKVLYFPRVASTMDAARYAARESAPEGTLVIAEEQTAGRGRRGRRWLSMSGNLVFSLVLRPTLDQLPSLIMVASLAVVRSIERLTSLYAAIKWPNDVLIGGKKVCGILIESDLKGDAVNFAIIGMGLNVSNVPILSASMAIPPTSLAAETGGEVSRLQVLSYLLLEFERLYLKVKEGKPVLGEWRQRLDTLGKQVQVDVNGVTEVGLAEDISLDGSLILRLADGSRRQIVAGDVSLRGT